MWVGVVTLFPEMFEAITAFGITGRAVDNGILELAFWNPRDFATDRHRTVDDKPYGGGPGMLMKVEPLSEAITAARKAAGDGARVFCLSPQGKRLDQQTLKELAGRERMILVAGRYEGIDERIIEAEIDEEYSIGDYVVSGGELPAMVVIDGITRLLPGAVGDPDSVERDSFYSGLLDYPQYTRPESFEERDVPAVLLSGNHEEINRWRLKQALGRTQLRRPDLLQHRELTETETRLLDEYAREHGQQDYEDKDND
jgi:tRNA (guanine37-N1)-methyltransferase